MSEERLQEIKDSISLQYKVQEANDLNNFNIFTDEEQELVEEIERLNNIINELEKWVVESIEKYTEDYLDWKYDRNVYLAGSKKLQNVLDKLQELKGSDKE